MSKLKPVSSYYKELALEENATYKEIEKRKINSKNQRENYLFETVIQFMKMKDDLETDTRELDEEIERIAGLPCMNMEHTLLKNEFVTELMKLRDEINEQISTETSFSSYIPYKDNSSLSTASSFRKEVTSTLQNLKFDADNAQADVYQMKTLYNSCHDKSEQDGKYGKFAKAVGIICLTGIAYAGAFLVCAGGILTIPGLLIGGSVGLGLGIFGTTVVPDFPSFKNFYQCLTFQTPLFSTGKNTAKSGMRFFESYNSFNPDMPAQSQETNAVSTRHRFAFT